MLDQTQPEGFLADLEAMVEFVEASFAHLPVSESTVPGPGGSFSPVEHCWHLADLEREGFQVRIRRLLLEDNPQLPDFDGGALARERNYKAKSILDGIAAFREARLENIRLLKAIRSNDWKRFGVQAAVGAITLKDLPRMMSQHDAAHRTEIETWLRAQHCRTVQSHPSLD